MAAFEIKALGRKRTERSVAVLVGSCSEQNLPYLAKEIYIC